MSFNDIAPFKVVYHLDYDPGADDVLHLFKVPTGWVGGATIKSARVTCHNAVAAHTANYFSVSLRNGGTAYSGTTQVAASVGGTGGWTALTPKEFTISSGELDAGEVLQLVYDEEGTGTFTAMVVEVEYAPGKGPS